MPAPALIVVMLDPDNFTNDPSFLDQERLKRAIAEKFARQSDLRRPLTLPLYQLVLVGPHAADKAAWINRENNLPHRVVVAAAIENPDPVWAFKELAREFPDVQEVLLVVEDYLLGDLPERLAAAAPAYAAKLDYAVIKAAADPAYAHHRALEHRAGWHKTLARLAGRTRWRIQAAIQRLRRTKEVRRLVKKAQQAEQAHEKAKAKAEAEAA